MRHRSFLAILGVIAVVTSSLGLVGGASTVLVTNNCYSALPRQRWEKTVQHALRNLRFQEDHFCCGYPAGQEI